MFAQNDSIFQGLAFHFCKIHLSILLFLTPEVNMFLYWMLSSHLQKNSLDNIQFRSPKFKIKFTSLIVKKSTEKIIYLWKWAWKAGQCILKDVKDEQLLVLIDYTGLHLFNACRKLWNTSSFTIAINVRRAPAHKRRNYNHWKRIKKNSWHWSDSALFSNDPLCFDVKIFISI